MSATKNETIVVSVGGSIIVPDEIDTTFLKKFKTFVERHIGSGKKFIIITGGGRTSRRYQGAANKVTKLTDTDLDWLGIHSSRLNAHLLRAIFYSDAHPNIITNLDKPLPKNKKIIIAAGMRPGSSTDLRAVQLAHKVGATKVVNLSNIDYVFTKDPKKYKTAEKIEDITWSEFRKLIPKKWDPGLNAPFDPIASREAQKYEIEVANINGASLSEFGNYIKGKQFKGTLIHS